MLEGSGLAGFRTTRWSVVRAARDGRSEAAREALATLCEDYWYPLFVFVRAQGYSDDEARELTQEFFARMLEPDALKNVREGGGKFRSYLLGAMKHFLMNERRRDRALKRGGADWPVSLDALDPDSAGAASALAVDSPDRQYDRQWALTVLERSLQRLELMYALRNRGHEFAALRRVLTGRGERIPYKRLAEDLSMTEGAVKTAVHRMRRRYAKLLQEEVAQTIGEGDDVSEELRYLFSCLED